MDVTLAVVGLALSAPIWIAAIVAIKLEDRGPVFYVQRRWGKHGRPFRVRKFRTMVPDSDQRFGITQASAADPRITRVGTVLRAMGIDELPQLISIVKGDMSFVGPRALAVGETVLDNGSVHREASDRLDDCIYARVPGFKERLAIAPGLTSIATVFLPKDVSPARKFRYDVYYVRHRSLCLDVRLIAASLSISITGRWNRGPRSPRKPRRDSSLARNSFGP